VEIIFIGTGSGKTSLTRFHSSILVTAQNHSLLIDSGDGISKALLNANVNFNKIDTIIITHNHSDHYSGLAGLITQMKLNGRTNGLKIFTYTSLQKSLTDFLNSCYLFEEKLGFPLSIKGYYFADKVSIGENFKFYAKQNSHLNSSNAPSYADKDLFVSSSLLLDVEGVKIIYTSDLGSADDLYLFKIDSADYIITESTHISLQDILKMIDDFTGKKIILTHIDVDNEEMIYNWLKQLSISIRKKIVIAEDRLIIKE